ncbi:MAG: hypothetical protein AB2L17_07735 [Lentimicrobium sp.]
MPSPLRGCTGQHKDFL